MIYLEVEREKGI